MGNTLYTQHTSTTGVEQDTANLGEVIQCLKEQLGDKLVAVVLFGSQARGEAAAQSDWDLLVLAESLPTRLLARYRFVKNLLPPYWRGRVSILAKTPCEFESVLPPLYLDIASDGKILYDPTGYIGRKLHQLQYLIHRLGLVRRRRGRDIVWGWKTSPKAEWSLRWEEASP